MQPANMIRSTSKMMVVFNADATEWWCLKRIVILVDVDPEEIQRRSIVLLLNDVANQAIIPCSMEI